MNYHRLLSEFFGILTATRTASADRQILRWMLSLALLCCANGVAVAAPTLTPFSQTRHVLAPGDNVNLTVAATGSGSLTHQWLRKGKAIAGATSATLAITNATYADSGWYLVDVTDSAGTTRSKPIFVSVAPVVSQIVSWGYDRFGPLTDIDAIAIYPDGWNFFVLHRNGTVTGYGSNNNGEIDVPVGLSDVVQVSSKAALKKDGTVVVWGNAAAVPAGLSDVVHLASNGVYGTYVALKSDGTVVAWGTNTFGQKNVPNNLTGVVDLAMGNWQAMAILGNGSVVSWGDGSSPPAGLSDVSAIGGGWIHALALKTDGTVVGWATTNNYGQATVPAGLNGVTALAAGGAHSLALRTDETVVAWGNSYYGQTTVPPTLSEVWAIGATEDSSYALRDSTGDSAPAVSVQPITQTASETQPISLTATVTGTLPLSLQWRKNGVNIPGATTATLLFPSFIASDAGSYDLVATNYLGSVTTNAAVLSVVASPAITTVSAARQVVAPAAPLNLSVTATGSGTLSYQWIHNGVIVPGANAETLAIPSATRNDGGWYLALVTDSVGTRRSAVMHVVVSAGATEVRVFGDTSSGRSAVPVGLNDAMEVHLSSFAARVYALKRDGTVVAWGDGTTGAYSVPAGLTGVISLAVGNDYVLALKSDGTVTGWGPASALDSIPSGLGDVVAISAKNHALALKSNGTVVAWGVNTTGSTTVPADLSGVISVAAGSGHSLVLKQDGTVLAWGYNYSGQTTVPAELTDVVGIDAGDYHSLALKNDATIVSWGTGYINPIPEGLENIEAVSGGYSHSMVLVGDGTVRIWGRDGLLNLMQPQPNLGGVLQIASGGSTAVAIVDPARDTAPVITTQPASRGTLEGEPVEFFVKLYGTAPFAYQWRKNGTPIAGATNSVLHLAAAAPGDAGNYDVVITNSKGSATSATATLTLVHLPVITSMSPTRQVLVPRQSLNLAVTATGTGTLGYQWVHNGRNIAGATNASYSVDACDVEDAGWYVVLISDDHGVRRSESMFVAVAPLVTRVRAWGGSNGPTSGGESVPPESSGVVAIAASPYHSLTIKRNGTVLAWGDDGAAQSKVPPGLADVVAVAGFFGTSGYGASVALKSDGTVVQWGGASALPAGLTNVVSIATGHNHALALKNNGTVVAWPGSDGGTPPAALKNVIAIAAGYTRSIALKSDGTVVTWGQTYSDETSMPLGLSGVIGIASGSRHSLALKSDGTVVAWGNNANGQIDVPPSLTGVVAISANASYSLALRSDGTVVEWGNSGQTVPPVNLHDVNAIAAGYYYSLGLLYAPVFETQPIGSARYEGQSFSFSVTMAGSGPFTYQWEKDQVAIPGATNASLTLPNLGFGDAGSYTVVVSNSAGSTRSAAAVLTVSIAPPSNAVISITVE